ncbi:type II toxin-antitoxin system PemK/MazF family toxin [Gryllotalpicola protaetiae]|uniref:mRNA interferase n=1 Tax=Gryllotalpicola protaetiae TaxID=2419771 RepID=A0A387BRK2_9MICO|nr:type II toxin-antitoxin system PemK/MazF family toxin [Gryllotalpicola protaetiae]AYG03689.1 type II toxin-antitoxin system PemK/MazF family toxin [Gryllotalpicola protaetiae]
MTARGDVVWVDFGQPRGSQPAKVRPAVIFQDDWLLATAISTVQIVPLTSNLALEAFPGNVLVPAAASGLDKDSVALVTQLGPVSREFLQPYAVGRLPAYLMNELGAGVRLVTGI